MSIDPACRPGTASLVEIGDRRASWYSCDWIERLGFLGTVHFVQRTHSATKIHPGLQEVRVGDRINTGRRCGRSAPTPATHLLSEAAELTSS